MTLDVSEGRHISLQGKACGKVPGVAGRLGEWNCWLVESEVEWEVRLWGQDQPPLVVADSWWKNQEVGLEDLLAACP